MQSLTQQKNSVKVQDGNSSKDPSPHICLAKDLSWEDRRELLRANLRLLSHRLRRNFPVLSSEIAQMAVLADDADSNAGATV